MSYPSESRAPGRPRDPAREAAILEAVLALVSEVGYARLSMEAVARRAGASKATVYRRWATKRDLVVAAVKAGPASAELVVDTGSLRGDLLALCEHLLRTLRSSEGGLVLGLLQAGLEDPELCRLLEETVGPTGAALPPEVLDRAVARGEVPENADPFAFEEVTGSVLILRVLNGLPVDQAYLEHLVDAVLLPALARPTPVATDLRPAIFASSHL
ncbi:TetR/AcrR family transcriptional regulator [Microlunatus antarcticus]|uniref:AcrR family transcriptional regulator n=1 Tax=Microlunatus antarcticus TaxID=53388 RepID=A0A7W5JZC7_9ACTN|nr:AcrR family transcriptional regulator [Microlunatus antarcticus]